MKCGIWVEPEVVKAKPNNPSLVEIANPSTLIPAPFKLKNINYSFSRKTMNNKDILLEKTLLYHFYYVEKLLHPINGSVLYRLSNMITFNPDSALQNVV